VPADRGRPSGVGSSNQATKNARFEEETEPRLVDANRPSGASGQAAVVNKSK
jgi:hypothetical protein